MNATHDRVPDAEAEQVENPLYGLAAAREAAPVRPRRAARRWLLAGLLLFAVAALGWAWDARDSPMEALLPPSATDVHERTYDRFPDYTYYFSARLAEPECGEFVARELAELRRFESRAALAASATDGARSASEIGGPAEALPWWSPVGLEHAPTWYWHSHDLGLLHFAQCSGGRLFYGEESN